MSELFYDPLTYVNWGAALFGIYFIWRYGPEMQKTAGPHSSYLMKFVLFMVVILGCLYISQQAGDIQLERLVEKSKQEHEQK